MTGIMQMFVGATAELSQYWIDQFTGRDSGGGSTAVDSSGNIYVGNYTRSGVGSGTYANGIMKLTTSGAITWQRRFGDTGVSCGITVDDSGNVYIATKAGTYFTVAMYDTNGSIQWQKQFTSYVGQAYDVVYASSGNIYVCGEMQDSGGKVGGSLAKITASTGALVWQRRIASATEAVRYTGVDIDSSENVYVTGYVSTSPQRAIAVKYNSSGTIQWQRTLTATSNEVAAKGEAIGIDSSGNVYLSLYYGVAGNYRMVLSKYNTSGTLQFSRSLYTTGKEVSGYAGAVSAAGDVYLVGDANTPDASNSAIIAKYDTAGTIQFQRTFDTSGVYDFLINIVVPTGTAMYSSGQGGANNQTNLFELPSDGTKTGTYGVYSYAAGSFTEAALTLTSNTSTYTGSTPTDTYATSSQTDAANSLTATRTAVP